MKAKHLIIVFALVGVLTSASIAWSKLSNRTGFIVVDKVDSLVAPKLNPQLLEKFLAGCSQIDPNKKEFLLVGTINVQDGADTTLNIQNVPYILSKKGKEFYFKIGQTETINAGDYYIFLDHNLKKVMVSKQQQVVPTVGMPNVQQMLKNLDGEFYSLTDKVINDTEKISLVNEHHLSCKEFSLRVSHVDKELKAVMLRLSNPQFPEDKKKDKKVELQLTQISEKSNLENYVETPVVKKVQATWTLQPAYKAYELIIL